MSPELLAAVTNLRIKLFEEYGCDYSYLICGKGKVIAASTINRGVVPEKELNKRDVMEVKW